MISFSHQEILVSLAYAVAYGVTFSALLALVKLILRIALALPGFLYDTLSFTKILPREDFKGRINLMENGKVFDFLGVIIFTLGFILISYLSLDGEIRIYMLLSAFAAVYLSNLVFYGIFIRFFLFLFDIIFGLLCIAIRLIIYPFMKLYRIKFK